MDSGPTVEKRQAFVIVRHIKFGSKKGGGKKKVDLDAEIQQQQQQASVGQSGDSTSIPEEDLRESCSEETEEENLPDEDERPKKVGTGCLMDDAKFDPPKVFDSRSNSSLPSDFQRPAQSQADTAPARQVTENRYARKTDQGRRFPPRHSVDNSNWDRASRDSFRFDPNERMRMPSDVPRQDRSYPNFSRNARVPAGEMQKPGMQRPDGPSPRDAGQSFGIFSTPRRNASNNQQ